jgi:hypothetical protein
MKHALLVLLFLATPAIKAATECPNAESSRIESLLTNKPFKDYVKAEYAVDLTNAAYVVAYDHIYDRWNVYEWNGNNLHLYSGKITPSGTTLTVEIPTRAAALMFVSRSNPFLFRGMAKPVTKADSDDIESLKKFASLAGGFLTSLVNIQGTKNVGVTVTIPVDDIKLQAAKLNQATAALLEKADKVGSLQATAIEYAQAVELRRNVTIALPDQVPMDSAAKDLINATAKVREESDKLAALLAPYCPQLTTAAKAALAATNTDDFNAALVEFNDLIAKPPPLSPEDKKKLTDAQKALLKILNPIAQFGVDVDPCPQESLDLRSEIQSLATIKKIPTLKLRLTDLDIIGTARNALTAAREALTHEPGALKIAGWLLDYSQIITLYKGTNGGEICDYIDAPVAVRSGSFVSEQGKKLTGGFTLSKTTDNANIYYTHPETLTRDVVVEPKSKWGFGVGLIYTPLDIKSWSATSAKVISKAKKDTLAGQTALFANYHPGWASYKSADLGAQVGFNTSTDKPGIYTGIAVDLGRWLRLGGGYTFQKSKKLTGDQKELVTPVNTDADIRTRDYFPGAWYVSLSISIEGISLFK